MKKLFIAEKPSVAEQFARALKVTAKRKDGYIEQDDYVITWCVGHLVTMSYPDAYDIKYKKWSLYVTTDGCGFIWVFDDEVPVGTAMNLGQS